tara:strand:+ start:865 stop:1467 length:603 start_codon:yes stop_codon:yes gene_type:complete
MTKLSAKVKSLNIAGVLFQNISEIQTIIFNQTKLSGFIPSYTVQHGTDTYQIGKAKLTEIQTSQGSLLEVLIKNKDKICSEGETFNESAYTIWSAFKNGEGVAVFDNPTKPVNLITQMRYAGVTEQQVKENPEQVLSQVPNTNEKDFLLAFEGGNIVQPVLSETQQIVQQPKMSDMMSVEGNPLWSEFQEFLAWKNGQSS